MSASAYALIGFISWALALLIVMEVIRSYLVISGQVPANGFTPDNGALSPFMRRLARAHAAFAVQMVIGAYWCWLLLI
ncbi:MAPEG family [Mesorhizobium sp. LSJC255A00]|uniref:hypothetical protein n=1 Tax=Mesorhizobium sp. LSJC255A00 TaxID=1287313 RepID=UPI0003CE9504|nr:hypothetical protein [Mesorhizobium sp. LSJC255A00]ESX18041.1 MAPEG family [Mesorhizobium sp. LSJC255A00]